MFPTRRLAPLALGVALMSCSGGGASPTPTAVPAGAADRQALVLQSADTIVAWIDAFKARAATLATASSALSTAASSGGDVSAARADAQAAWKDAMADWQRLELLQVGPAGSSSMVAGGQDLRDEIYSWPTVNPCKVDQVTASRAYESASFIADNLVNAYGLDALEYLLFHTDAENLCASSAYPNAADGSGDLWADLSEAEIARRRAAYASVVASAVSFNAAFLARSWAADGGGFYTNFTTAGQAGSNFDSNQEVVDALFAALYYLDLSTKDMKLAEPAGISADCLSDTCPEAVESRFSLTSSAHIVRNLETFQAFYLGTTADGGEGVGYDDLLRGMGAGDLADTMTADLATALTAAQALPPDLAYAVAQEPDAVQAAYDGVKVVTDLLKSQFVTVLNLTIPEEGDGDND